MEILPGLGTKETSRALEILTLIPTLMRPCPSLTHTLSFTHTHSLPLIKWLLLQERLGQTPPRAPLCPIPWNAQGDVHLASACKVEGVEGHLGGGLSDALGSQQAHSLARLTQ